MSMIVFGLIVLGLIFGSFVNAFVWRLHNKRNWVNERSECTHCHHVLVAADLIPVLSWLWLRGKCRYCHKKIEDNPIAELIVPILFVTSYLCWPLTFQQTDLIIFIFWLLFLVGFTILAVYDLRWLILPDKVVFALMGLALAQVILVTILKHNAHILISALVGASIISGIFYLLFQISDGKWIGGGDVKLAVVLGLLSGGALQSFLLLFVASVSGSFAALPLVLLGKASRKTQLPFGPFLIFGLIIVQLFGKSILNWYGGILNL